MEKITGKNAYEAWNRMADGKMNVYKGTDKDIKCRGYQFTPGVQAITDSAKLCESGFHASKSPLDVLRYYNPGEGSRYFEAELEDVSEELNTCDSTIVGKKLTLEAEIGIVGLAKAHVEAAQKSTDDVENITDYRQYGNAVASCVCGNAATSGIHGNAVTLGNLGNAVSSGHRGYAAVSGEGGVACISGDRGSAEAIGNQTLAVAWGEKSKARGKLGSYIVCTEYWDNRLRSAKLGLIDGIALKPDTWYTLNFGEFIEIPE